MAALDNRIPMFKLRPGSLIGRNKIKCGHLAVFVPELEESLFGLFGDGLPGWEAGLVQGELGGPGQVVGGRVWGPIPGISTRTKQETRKGSRLFQINPTVY